MREAFCQSYQPLDRERDAMESAVWARCRVSCLSRGSAHGSLDTYSSEVMRFVSAINALLSSTVSFTLRALPRSLVGTPDYASVISNNVKFPTLEFAFGFYLAVNILTWDHW